MDETPSASAEETPLSKLRSLVTEDPLSPENRSESACSRRLKLAAQMSDDGIQMMHMKIRRENPTLGPDQVRKMLAEWLADTPEPGFVEGWTVRNMSRFST